MLPIAMAAQIDNDQDRDFLSELYSTHYKMLFKYAYSIVRNSDDANDLVQTLFLEMTSYIQALREAKSDYAYLKVSLQHLIFQFLKRRNEKGCDSYEEFTEKYGKVLPAPDLVEDTYFNGERDREVRSLVLELKPLSRRLLMLHYYWGMSMKEISGLLSITPEYAYVIHKRARDALRKLLPEEAVL